MSTGAPNPALRAPVAHQRRDPDLAQATAQARRLVASTSGSVAPSVPDLGDPAVYGLARQIYWRNFRARLVSVDIDPEDGQQEVFMRLITRARSPSRWDATRGCLSTWLFVAMNGITLNMVDAHLRYERRSGKLSHGEDAALTARVVEEMGDEEPTPEVMR